MVWKARPCCWLAGKAIAGCVTIQSQAPLAFYSNEWSDGLKAGNSVLDEILRKVRQGSQRTLRKVYELVPFISILWKVRAAQNFRCWFSLKLQWEIIFVAGEVVGMGFNAARLWNVGLLSLQHAVHPPSCCKDVGNAGHHSVMLRQRDESFDDVQATWDRKLSGLLCAHPLRKGAHASCLLATKIPLGLNEAIDVSLLQTSDRRAPQFNYPRFKRRVHKNLRTECRPQAINSMLFCKAKHRFGIFWSGREHLYEKIFTQGIQHPGAWLGDLRRDRSVYDKNSQIMLQLQFGVLVQCAGLLSRLLAKEFFHCLRLPS